MEFKLQSTALITMLSKSQKLIIVNNVKCGTKQRYDEVMLQRYPGLHILLCRCKKTCFILILVVSLYFDAKVLAYLKLKPTTKMLKHYISLGLIQI